MKDFRVRKIGILISFKRTMNISFEDLNQISLIHLFILRQHFKAAITLRSLYDPIALIETKLIEPNSNHFPNYHQILLYFWFRIDDIHFLTEIYISLKYTKEEVYRL